ncbi:MAG TPA: carboxypeptidase-like regulatory domain-containing protein, partial [Planctomycetota bacterium]|nr:carboxypeptidase-like regulatory domain-containing protein [Planctomycetota bacterium]
MKLAIRLGVVVVVACVAWWAWRQREPRLSVAETEASSSSSAAPEIPRIDVAPPEMPPAASREIIAEPATTAVGETAPTVSLVRLSVITLETKAPLAGKIVGARPTNATTWGSKNQPKQGRAALGDNAITGADGRAEIEVEPGRELTIDVVDAFRPTIIVPPLRVGEVREVLVEMKTQDDLTLFGRLVDVETKAAIPAGLLWIENGRGESPRGGSRTAEKEFRSGADGGFELHGRSWLEPVVNAMATGYSRVTFSMDQGHESPEKALEVRMSRAAALAVEVLEKGNGVAKARVDVTTDASNLQQDPSSIRFSFSDDPHWRAVTDTTGRAAVEDLPPNVPLLISVAVEGKPARRNGAAITLSPGERKPLQIELGAGATILGRIEDTQGSPVAGCTIWRILPDDDEGRVARLLREHEKPVATALSDETGRFRFPDVAEGDWLVGPKPSDDRKPDANDPLAIPALAEVVQVAPGATEVELVLRVDRGLYLTGIALDPEGKPLKGVYALARGTQRPIYVNGESDASGQFTVGPMPAGEYKLQGMGFVGQHANSEDVIVHAGDAGLVLKLRAGGKIRGRVVDAAGKPRAANTAVACEGKGTAG